MSQNISDDLRILLNDVAREAIGHFFCGWGELSYEVQYFDGYY